MAHFCSSAFLYAEIFLFVSRRVEMFGNSGTGWVLFNSKVFSRAFPQHMPGSHTREFKISN